MCHEIPTQDVYDDLDRLASIECLDDVTDTEAFDMDLLGNRNSVTVDGTATETYAVDDATNCYTAITSN